MPKKKQKGTHPVFGLSSTMRTQAIMAFGEACHELHRPCCPRPSSAEKKYLQSKTDGSRLGSQQSLESLTSKETDSHPSHLSHFLLPPQSRPPKRKNNNNNTCRQLHDSCITKVRPTAATSGLCPAPHPRTLITNAGNVTHTLSQSAPHPGLVLRSLIRNQQSTPTHSFIIKGVY